MTSPYDIEELYPHDAAESVRLPRRQTGSAPQELAVTLLADYTLRTRAWLPSAAIVALLTETGISEAGARTTISRLARRGILEASRHGRHSSYRLTEAAAIHLSIGGSWIISATAGTEPWSGWWTLIAFSLPQHEGTQRRNLRNHLRWHGYAPLYDGLWISPRELTPQAKSELAQITPGMMTVFHASHIELGAANRRDPLDAWDIAAIAEHYESFIDHWSPLLPRIRSRDVSGAEAVKARTQVMDTYRLFPVLDPQLPLSLLPAGWLRDPARKLFTAVYDGLARAAQAHVQTIASQFTRGTPPDIQAHTVEDMLAGVHSAR